MKKFYLSIMALVGLASTTKAQNPAICPTAVEAKYYTVPVTPAYCKLFIGGGPAATPADTPVVSLIEPSVLGGQPIPDLNGNNFTKLSNTGGATVAYNCQTIDHIEIDFNVGGVHYTCSYPVAAGGALPIKLSAFTGRLATETEATLSWTSSIEENSFQYEVQRSADGKNFVTVGTVKAAGTSLESIKYAFNDPLPGAGAYFYRLNMIDIDGKKELSKVVYVNSKKGAGIVTKVFPNPFNSEIQLIGATSADLNTQGNVRVFNTSGQQINFRIVGANAITIDPSAPKGMYFLKFRNSTNTSEQIFKLVKQ
ncbi:T9SS type A sorting domain-containing protein [Niastella caeni]|nr:T9SS type A sorting domain-containing protein [Niastella caeni]